MSYYIIKHIKIENNEVQVNCACNNVYPRNYDYCKSESLTKILNEQGREALDLEILKAYESGNFQRGNNKYTSALLRLRQMPEYENFDWRRNDTDDVRKTKAFDDLLIKALNQKFPKDKFIVTKDYFGKQIYLWKKTKLYAKWTHEVNKAKQFRYIREAEMLKSCFEGGELWQILKIN